MGCVESSLGLLLCTALLDLDIDLPDLLARDDHHVFLQHLWVHSPPLSLEPVAHACTSRNNNRPPRAPKRSPTPTSATFPSEPASPAPQPPASPAPPAQKPLYLCSPFVEAALVKGNFKTIVMLPKYVDVMEWVAVNSAYRLLLAMSYF